MVRVFEIDGVVPVVDPAAFVHPHATLIGGVIVGPRCYVGPGASLRGDFGRIRICAGANIQDGCILHGYPGKETVVEEDGHVGHGAILHGCHIGRNAMIGMGAIIMDNAEVGESAVVGAGSFVKTGMVVAPRTLVIGSPARFVRRLSDDEVAWKSDGTRVYQQLSVRSLQSMREVEALTDPSAQTGKLQVEDRSPDDRKR